MSFYAEPFATFHNLSSAASKIYLYFFISTCDREPRTITGTTFDFQKAVNLSQPTVAGAIKELIQVGLVRPIASTGRGRRTTYVCDHRLVAKTVFSCEPIQTAKTEMPVAIQKLSEAERLELERKILCGVNSLFKTQRYDRLWHQYALTRKPGATTTEDFLVWFFETKWLHREQEYADADCLRMLRRIEQNPFIDSLLHEFPVIES